MPTEILRAAYSTSSATSAGDAGRSSDRRRAGVRVVVTRACEGEAASRSPSLRIACQWKIYCVCCCSTYSFSALTFVVLLPRALTTLFTSPSSLVTPAALLLRALKGVRRVPKYGSKADLPDSLVAFFCRCPSSASISSSLRKSSSLPHVSCLRRKTQAWCAAYCLSPASADRSSKVCLRCLFNQEVMVVADVVGSESRILCDHDGAERSMWGWCIKCRGWTR